jgi:hypothetical protein
MFSMDFRALYQARRPKKLSYYIMYTRLLGNHLHTHPSLLHVARDGLFSIAKLENFRCHWVLVPEWTLYIPCVNGTIPTFQISSDEDSPAPRRIICSCCLRRLSAENTKPSNLNNHLPPAIDVGSVETKHNAICTNCGGNSQRVFLKQESGCGVPFHMYTIQNQPLCPRRHCASIGGQANTALLCDDRLYASFASHQRPHAMAPRQRFEVPRVRGD